MTTRYGEAALDAVIAEVRATRTRRNIAAYRAAIRAYGLHRGGHIDDPTRALESAIQATGLPPREVAAILRSAQRRATPEGPTEGESFRPCRPPRRPAPPLIAAGDQWQRELGEVVARAVWAASRGGIMRDYLLMRGFPDASIASAISQGWIGWVERPARVGDAVIPPSLIFPWRAWDGTLVGATYRPLPPRPTGPKQLTVRGSQLRGAWYPHRPIDPAYPTIVVEGELDALILASALTDPIAGPLATVITLGGASARPEWLAPDVEATLRDTDSWVAPDHDPAGYDMASAWRDVAAIALPPRDGADWLDCVHDGVDVYAYWRDRIIQRELTDVAEMIQAIGNPASLDQAIGWSDLWRERYAAHELHGVPTRIALDAASRDALRYVVHHAHPAP